MSIAHWPEAERPREKLLRQGAATLNDSELLAIFLRTGVKGINAVELARSLLHEFGSLTGLLGASLEQFKAKPGLGEAKYAQLMACTELARRALSEPMRLGDALSSPRQVRDYLRLSIGRRDVETFVVIFLSAQNRLIEVEEVFKGTLTETRVYPREVLRRALQHNAAALIVAHNHPSGVSEPSNADRILTDTLKRALELVDIRLLDHFVVTGGHAESFAERGWL
ncbi:DNA repair protein RadC [Chromobacterium phragmitis]|uniref:RadC family protein n=1 Tax=Chromobacterium amazonense TaxID=1382803 RepID=UPI0021B7B33E|nr:DNA repair protein RadC [Chromobacterium amazonense]MBM2884374.1 DNA repair protein RadC [Chromobacterium amazonense]MDE1711303.1 DNA repair protein RadC [Chromobacterium amazonense]